ncbi:MAG: hypothetical protein K8T91_04165 [Planctomycetes bacterium]|nr:hypothetical protein [Planctomycetota bacterium]
METQLRPASRSTIHPLIQPNRPQSKGATRQVNSGGRRFGGMHLRHDKRFPLSRQGNLSSIQPVSSRVISTPPSQNDELKSWKEAIMLWLSWNSAQEKLTEKMYKAGQDQRKLETLMDEMDMFRQRAIMLSERLLRE